MGSFEGNKKVMDNNLDQLKKPSVARYIFLSLLLPPFTLFLVIYLASRKKILHLAMPALCITFSLITFGINFAELFTVQVPQKLTQIGFNVQTVTGPQIKLAAYLLIGISAAGIAFGIYFRKKAGKEGYLGKNIILLLFGIMILETLLSFYIFYYTTSALYKVTAPIIQGL